MGYTHAKKLMPLLLVFPTLLFFQASSASSEDDEYRDVVLDPLSEDELMQARRNAFFGDGRSAYLVYMQLAAHEMDIDSHAYLRLSAELGYCAAVHEVSNTIRNQEGDDSALRYIREMKKNRKTKECFSNRLFRPIAE